MVNYTFSYKLYEKTVKLYQNTRCVTILSYTVIKEFGGLVIFRAIAGNITSYSREIYAPLKSLLLHGFFPAIAGFFPSFVFPAIAGIFRRFILGIVPGSAWELSQLFMVKETLFLSKRRILQCLYSVEVATSGCLGLIPAGYNVILFHHSII